MSAAMKACRRLASRRQASSSSSSPPAAALWVSETMLERSFQRFQRRLIASSRGLSLHRGPLESRRRLGKRHMGAVMSSPPPYRLLWHFELMGNPNEWKWEAPTTPAQRREKEGKMSLSNIGDKLVKWLEASDFDKPYLQPPVDINASTTSTHVGLSSKIADMRTTICLLGQVDKQALDRCVHKFRQVLRRRISAGHVSVQDLMLAMEPLDSVTWERIGDDELARSFTTSIQSYIVSTLGRMRRQDADGMYLEAWLAMANRVLSMPGTDATFTVLRCLVKESLPSDRHHLSPELLVNIGRSFLLTQTNRSKSSSGWLLRFARFAQMLERLDATQRSTIEPGLLAYILHYSSITGHKKAHDLQYSWLLLQAHFKSLSPTAFEAILDGFRNSYGPLSEYKSWQLATARLLATGVIDHDQHSLLVTPASTSARSRWTSLATAVQGKDEIAALCETLRAVHCLDTLAWSLVFSEATRERDDAIRRIISHPGIDRHVIWRAIDKQRRTIMRARRSGQELPSHSQPRALRSLVAKMSSWYLVAEKLSSRRAFQGVELCVKAQRAMCRWRGPQRGRLSPTVLENLTEVIIRDMRTGPGRAERLEHLLRVISEQRGTAEARKARMALYVWRQKIREHTGFS